MIREVGELDAAIAPTDMQAHTLVELPPSIAQLVPPLPHQEQPPPKKLLLVSRAIQLLRRVLHNVGRTKEGVAREEARRGQRGSERNAEGCDIFQNDWGHDVYHGMAKAQVHDPVPNTPLCDDGKQGSNSSHQ